jgi:RNA polymerase sigma-70 factor (ECF subfamily)
VVPEPEPLPVSEARAGNPAAWDALFKRYQLPLYAYVFQLAQNEQTSLDIVQETFVSAVRHIQSLREDERFGSWLFGIAHQKCIQRWRNPRREVEWEEQIAENFQIEEDPRALLIRREDEAELMKALNQLPVPQRSVLLLYFLEEFSIDEIGGITRASNGTVKSRLHYAKKALRKIWLKNHENTP